MSVYTANTYGGAVYAYTNSAVEISNCSFKGNEAAGGGAIFP